MASYDVIVVGLGGHGSSIAYHAALRGLKVLGIEQFDIGHAMGSSHGVHRLFRLGYAEGQSYVPLLMRAVELWRDLEAKTGHRLFIKSGVMSASPHGKGTVEDARLCSVAFDLRHEILPAKDVNRRFPAFNLAPDMVGLFQPDSGFVMSEQTIAAHIQLASAAGADLRARVRVERIEQKGADRVVVTTSAGTFEAGQVVVSAGAWTGKLAPNLSKLHSVGRRALGFFVPRRPADFSPEVCPGYSFKNDDIAIYGFPIFGFPGVKIGRNKHLGEQGDPDELSRVAGQPDEDILREGLRAFLRDVDGPCLRLQACVVTDTPDEHFIIDRLSDQPLIHIVSMCSGHGFKFTAVTGEIVADRLQGKADRYDLSPFRLDRFSQLRPAA